MEQWKIKETGLSGQAKNFLLGMSEPGPSGKGSPDAP